MLDLVEKWGLSFADVVSFALKCGQLLWLLLLLFSLLLLLVESSVSLKECQKGHLRALAAIHNLFNLPYLCPEARCTWHSPF